VHPARAPHAAGEDLRGIAGGAAVSRRHLDGRRANLPGVVHQDLRADGPVAKLDPPPRVRPGHDVPPPGRDAQHLVQGHPTLGGRRPGPWRHGGADQRLAPRRARQRLPALRARPAAGVLRRPETRPGGVPQAGRARVLLRQLPAGDDRVGLVQEGAVPVRRDARGRRLRDLRVGHGPAWATPSR